MGPYSAAVDGDNSIGMVTSTFAMRQAMEKARGKGIGLAVLGQSAISAAAGHYAAMAAQQGFIALAMANDIPSVIAPSARGVRSPAPIPGRCRADGLARSDHARRGLERGGRRQGDGLSLSWQGDSRHLGGRQRGTADDRRGPVFCRRALQPFAGHKGYGIALLIEMLAGAVLSGSGLTWQIKAWIESYWTCSTNHGGCFIAIDVSSLMPLEQFQARVSTWPTSIRSAKAAGSDHIYLPGDIEAQNRQR